MPRTQYTHRCTYCAKEIQSRRRAQDFCSSACANRARRPRAIADRFWEKVDSSGGPEACWPWKDAPDRWGYGCFRIGSRKTHAHRVAYALTFGPLPRTSDGKSTLACHACDNPICCNPAHIFPGSNEDNIADRHKKGRDSRGERHPRARVTDDSVRDIRQRHAAGATLMSIAVLYGVSHGTVSSIVARRTWKHVA